MYDLESSVDIETDDDDDDVDDIVCTGTINYRNLIWSSCIHYMYSYLFISHAYFGTISEIYACSN